MEAYLAAVQKYGFTNKLPEVLQQQADNERITNVQRVPFFMAAFREQLVKVFVSNDLVCLLPGRVSTLTLFIVDPSDRKS